MASSKVADIVLTRKGLNGGPAAEIFVEEGTTLKEIQAAQQLIYSKLIKKVGLKVCEGCRSGLDILIRDRLRDVVRVDLQTGEIQ
jgi:hypothetical protein